MWSYSKKLEYPVKIVRPNAAAAKVIISQLGGPSCNIRSCKKPAHILKALAFFFYK